MTATPNAMPRKANPLRMQLLAGLIETKAVTTTFKRLDPDSPDPKKPNVIETKLTRQGLRYPLAQNVSEANVERLARRWVA